MPCYNEAAMLPHSIEAIGNQTEDLCGVELIVIANNCTDRSAQIAQDIGSKFLHTIVVETSQQGKKNALNLGVLAAHSETVFCTDADVLLHPSALSLTLDELETDNHRLVGALTEPLYSAAEANREAATAFALLRHGRRLACRPHRSVSGPLMAFRPKDLPSLNNQIFSAGASPDDTLLSAMIGHYYGIDSIYVNDAPLVTFIPPQSLSDCAQQFTRYRSARQIIEQEHPELGDYFMALDTHCENLIGEALWARWRDISLELGVDFDSWHPIYEAFLQYVDSTRSQNPIYSSEDKWDSVVSTKSLH